MVHSLWQCMAQSTGAWSILVAIYSIDALILIRDRLIERLKVEINNGFVPSDSLTACGALSEFMRGDHH